MEPDQVAVAPVFLGHPQRVTNNLTRRIYVGYVEASIWGVPDIDGDKTKRSRFKAYPPGYFHIDLAEVHTRAASS